MTEEANGGQHLTDDEVLAQLNKVVDDELPDGGEDEVDDKEKKVRHAFAEKKRAAKQAIALAERYRKEAEELRGKQGNTPPPQPATDVDAQARGILGQLTIRAMNNLGIAQVTEANQELVRMERDRLYTKQMNEVEQRRDLEVRAPGIVDEALNNIRGLDDNGAREIKKRLNNLDVLQRTNPSVIRTVVSQYLGEQVLSGHVPTVGGDGGNGDGSGDTGDDDDLTAVALEGRREKSAAAAAATDAARVGRSGVRPGKGAGGDTRPKPATPEEAREMVKHGMTDLQAYRDAKVRKANYLGH